MTYRQGKITVGQDFPLKPGEVLRIRLGGTRELRVKVGPQIQEKPAVFGTKIYYHHVGTNKDSISLVGNERKLRRI